VSPVGVAVGQENGRRPMFDRILVPLDGSPESEAILPHLPRLIRGADSEILLVRSEHPLAVENPGAVVEMVLAGAKEYLLEIQAKLPQGVRSRILECLGTPAPSILRVADEERATLIAMATHGRTGVRRLFLGSVAEQVIRKSPLPVYALHPAWSYELIPEGRLEERSFRTILLPLDGLERWESSAQAAQQWAGRFGSRILLLPLWSPFGEGSGRPSSGEGNLDMAKRELVEVSAWLAGSGADSRSVILEGEPVDKILQACADYPVDLIVMTPDRRWLVSRSLGRGLEERVLREAKRPVLAVNPASAVGARGDDPSQGRLVKTPLESGQAGGPPASPF
jgi:nucleotide-binding universal stress UspA family protein